VAVRAGVIARPHPAAGKVADVAIILDAQRLAGIGFGHDGFEVPGC